MKYIKLFESFWGDEASGILPISKDTGRILLGLRSDNVLEPHTWGNFGGAIGLDDDGLDEEKLSPSENAIKEMNEEIGIDAYDYNIELIESYIFQTSNFKYYNFLGLVEHEFQIDKNDLNWEVDDTRWFSYQEMIELDNLHFGIKKLIEESGEQIYNLSKKYSKNIINNE